MDHPKNKYHRFVKQNKPEEPIWLLRINKKKMTKKDIVLSIPDELIMNKIYYIRGHKVMLDSDLAELYQVENYKERE